MCQHTKLLQYYWLHSLCCVLYPHDLFYKWIFVTLNPYLLFYLPLSPPHFFWRLPVYLCIYEFCFALLCLLIYIKIISLSLIFALLIIRWLVMEPLLVPFLGISLLLWPRCLLPSPGYGSLEWIFFHLNSVPFSH